MTMDGRLDGKLYRITDSFRTITTLRSYYRKTN